MHEMKFSQIQVHFLIFLHVYDFDFVLHVILVNAFHFDLQVFSHTQVF